MAAGGEIIPRGQRKADRPRRITRAAVAFYALWTLLLFGALIGAPPIIVASGAGLLATYLSRIERAINRNTYTVASASVVTTRRIT